MDSTIDFNAAAECLKTLAHPKRLELIYHLLHQNELSVGQLAVLTELQPHVASEQLTLLKDRGFIGSRKEGRSVFYYIKEHALDNIMNCIKQKFKEKT